MGLKRSAARVLCVIVHPSLQFILSARTIFHWSVMLPFFYVLPLAFCVSKAAVATLLPEECWQSHL